MPAVPSTGVAARRLTSGFRLNSSFLAGLLAALWAASLVPLVGAASANQRLVEAFATDEVLQLNLLREAAANQTFALTFGPYGHFVFNVILGVLRVVPGELTDARIVHTGRAVSVFFAAAMLWLTFVWTRRVFGGAAAWIAFAALIVNATLYTWAVVLKPDMAQLFFLMLALALTCRLADEPRLRWLVLASSAAGLAFACKYSGLFVLPIIGAVSIWCPIASLRPDMRVRALRWLTGAKAAVLFSASMFFETGWIAAHLTEDGRIDTAISPETFTALSMAARGAALAAALIAVTPWFWSALRRRPPLLAVVWSWTVAAAVFAVTFVAASPYSLRRAAFAKGLLVEASYAAEPFTTAWFVTWSEGIGAAIGWPVLVAALFTMAGLAWVAARHGVRPRAAESILMAWVVLYALVLSAPVHEFYVHYALPLAPPAAMLAGRGAVAAAGWFGGLFDRRRLAAGVLAAAVLIVLIPPGATLLAARARLLNREETSDAVFLGKWLECRAPGSTRIAYDYFAYAPPAFADATPTWGGTREWLSRFDPDVVIVNSVTAAAVMVEARHAEYYECLAGGRCGYEPVLARGDFTMFAKSGQAAALLTSPPASTPGCAAYRNP